MNIFKIALNLIISGTISLLILALFLYYLSSQAGSVSLDKVIDLVTAVSLPILLGYISVYIIGTWFRALRFQKIISADTTSNVPSLRNMYIITMIRNMVVDLLPSRSGELFYIGLVKKSDNVPTATATSSLGMSIWLDLVVLGILIIGIAAFGMITGAFEVNIGIQWLFLFAAVIVSFPIGLAIIHRWQSRSKMAKKLHQSRVFQWFFDLLETSRLSMQSGIFTPCLLYSFGVRICKYFGMYLIFMAVSNGVAEHFNEINAFDVLITLVASEFSASLPLPALMSFGTYEAGGTIALTALGVPLAIAALVLLSTHIVSQLIDYIMGGLGMIMYWTLGLAKFKSETTEKAKTKPRIGVKQLVILALASVVGFMALTLAYNNYQSYKVAKTMIAPEPGVTSTDFEILAPQSQQQLATLFNETNKKGFMVWSSNRYGNHDIIRMSLPEMEISRLTTSKYTDAYPRLSPDGTKVAFVRSHTPWLSFRNYTDWDVIILDIATGKETVLAKNGYQPNWDNDGQHVYYVSDGGRGLTKININTGNAENVFLTGQGEWPTKMALSTPSFNEEKGNFALTYRKPLPTAGFLQVDDIGMQIASNNACQTTWADDNSFAYYIGGGGRMKNAIYKYDYASQESKVWLDMPGDFSHEYFPKVSTDNSLLVFGASAGGHEHDTEDYELFLWPTDKPAEEAIRLTFHTGNDNWPDIFIQ